MCGIAGILNLNGQPVNPNIIRKMTDIQAHRGPDDYGYAVFDVKAGVSRAYQERVPDDFAERTYNLAFGHRRLSIIDLTTLGHQPMASKDGAVWIIYNGEIYNYLELRSELSQEGYSFSSQSDTEVILNSYRHWGIDCLSRFNGMWAFAIWDQRKRTLYCARDHLGKKPFYYYRDETTFVFASEIKSLLCHPRVPRRVNEEKVYDYLYLHQHEYRNDSFFQDIHQLPAATLLEIQIDGRTEERCWWQIPIDLSLGIAVSAQVESQRTEQFLELLRDAVRIRFRADVPVGISLSGGIDSSLILSLAMEQMESHNTAHPGVQGGKLATFTSRPVGTIWDEGRYVDTLTEGLELDRHDVILDGQRFWDELPDLMWHQEQPSNSSSMFAQRSVMKEAASSGVKVVLDGQGADELFGGYERFYSSYHVQLALAGRYHLMLSEARSAAFLHDRSVLHYLMPVMHALLPNNIREWAHRLRRSHADPNQWINPDLVKRYAERETSRRHLREIVPRNLQAALHDATAMSTLIFILRSGDRNSMASSVETRQPFLDHRIIEFAFSLPAAAKIHDGWTKHIIRQASTGILPDAIRLRRDKLGFPTPEAQWLREGSEHIRHLFSRSPMSADFVDTNGLLANMESLLARDASVVPEVWRPICLEYWLQQYFGNHNAHFE